MFGSKKGIRGALALVAVAVPMAIAAPAQATVTSSGCTVTPLAPEFHNQWTVGGDKRIQYKVTVTCTTGRSITITQERKEADVTSADDFIGSSVLTNDFTLAGGTVTRTVTATLADADPWGDDNEKMYQRVHFTVSSNGVTSPVTAWDTSPTVTFHLLVRDSRRAFNHRQLAIIDFALRDTTARFTVASHSRSHDVSGETARQDLQDLGSCGLLVRIRSGHAYVWLPVEDLRTTLISATTL